MTLRQVGRDGRTFAVIAVLGVSGAFLFAQGRGAAGMALGLAGAGFSITALWYVIRLLGRTTPDSGRAKFATFIVVIAFFAKLPFYMLVGILARQIGGAAPTCFLLGVGLVYFCLVGWALAQG